MSTVPAMALEASTLACSAAVLPVRRPLPVPRPHTCLLPLPLPLLRSSASHAAAPWGRAPRALRTLSPLEAPLGLAACACSATRSLEMGG